MIAASIIIYAAWSVAGSGTEAPPPDVQSLVLAERAFARASVADGMREAFLAHLAPEAVIFRPGPVPARDWFEERPPVPGRLSWEPLFVDVARSGNFGYTADPKKNPNPGIMQPPRELSHGHYVSVWHREPDGGWRVIVDIGNNHPRPESTLGDLGYAAPRSGSGNRRAGSKREEDPAAALRSTDLRFAEKAVRAGTGAACDELADDAVRVYRSGLEPFIGKKKACAALTANAERSASQPLGSGMARSSDFGYVYGNLVFLAGEEDGPGDTGGPGSFLRILKADADGAWKLVLDASVLHPQGS